MKNRIGDAPLDDLVASLDDLHETVPRKGEQADGWAHEFRMRARSLLEKFQHDTRAVGTMDRPTFVRAYSWMFIMIQTSTQLTMVNENNHRQISFRAIEVENGHRAVEFFDKGIPTDRFTPDQAAEVLWDFLQDKVVEDLNRRPR